VFRLGPGQALVQSVDFFTPIVDDPRMFGAIAAANALSDLYAMGARPVTAMALVGFPNDKLGADVLVEILAGGAEKVQEAGAVIVGGHSVRDPELKYGLSVTGLVDPERMRTNENARPGDVLVLTKPLGTGLVANWIKSGDLDEDAPDVAVVVRGMATLNAAASDVLGRHGVRASTDITGFGLLGHARYMADASRVGLRIDVRKLPVWPIALPCAEDELGGGSKDNMTATSPFVDRAADLPEPLVRIAYDAQTSGGLLAAVPAGVVDAIVRDLKAAGTLAAAVVGEVTAANPGRIALV
jgi:selenide,water dikinase